MVFEDLQVGQSAETTHVVTEAKVVAFAELSGDNNPVHLNASYAAATPFKERIVHGALLGAFVSALISTQMPGPGAISKSVTFRFKRPVKLGATVTVRVEIESLDSEKANAALSCICSVNGKKMLVGEALLYVPRRE